MVGADALEATAFDDILRLTGLLNLLYAEYLRATPTVPRTKESTHVVKPAIEYGAQNFRQNITLGGMAKQLGYHEKYLSSALTASIMPNSCCGMRRPTANRSPRSRMRRDFR